MDIEKICNEINNKIDCLKNDNNKKLDIIKTQITRIETSLLGYDGKSGLIDSHNDLREDYFKFKTEVLIIIGVLVGSGALGFSLVGGLFS